MITEDRQAVTRRMESILSRIECSPWRLGFDHYPGTGSVIVYTLCEEGSRLGSGPPKRVKSLEACDIMDAAFEAIVASERERVRHRFAYRGRDIFHRRYFSATDGHTGKDRLAYLIEEIDRAETIATSSLRFVGVTSQGGFIQR